MSRVLLRHDLPWVAPRYEWPALQDLAARELAAAKHERLDPGNCGPEALELPMALACAGVLEAELRMSPSAAVRPQALENASAELLPGLFRCPWTRLAESGWPLFALLGRIARRLAGLPPGPGDCGGRGQAVWRALANSTARGGLLVPPDTQGATVWQYAVPDLDMPSELAPRNAVEAAAAAACFWEAADLHAIPTRPVCVSVAEPGETRNPIAARDCNDRWPACPGPPAAEEPGPPRLYYWLQLPRRRELASDTVRDEQRPFCVVDQDGAVAAETDRLLAQLAQEAAARPLVFVEVGANYGDCTFVAFAASQRFGWPLAATSYEPHPEAVAVFRRSLLLNQGASQSIRVREAAVGAGGAPTLTLVMPAGSTVHASVKGESLAVEAEKSRLARSQLEVQATSLDQDFAGATIDLLLIGVSGGETQVLKGAHELLSQRRVRTVVGITWQWAAYREALESYGYDFVTTRHWKDTSWGVARLLEQP